jgi:hypothetical protein
MGVTVKNWGRLSLKRYDLTELAKHYTTFEETFSLIWFEPDSGPEEPVKNWGGSRAEETMVA